MDLINVPNCAVGRATVLKPKGASSNPARDTEHGFLVLTVPERKLI